MKKYIFLAAGLVFFISLPLAAGELDSRMAKVVKTFTSSAKELGLSTATLAVLPFKTDKKLAEQRVDYACGELLTNRFVEGRSFKVVERARLDAALKEQALGAGGVTESATAAKLGQLLGAKLVIIGSVSRLGSAYHMSTEMVDSETGEIIASDVTEVEAKTFDKDAGNYLVLVPEYDALGIYLAGGFGASSVKKLPPVSTGGGNTLTPGNKESLCRYYGVGIRYFISPKWMADGAFMLGVRFGGNYALARPSGPGASSFKNYTFEELDDSLARVLINRVIPVSEKFKAYAGVGMTSLNEGDLNTDFVKVTAKNAEMLTFRGILEWKLTQRFGLSVSGLYYPSPATIQGRTDDAGAYLIRQYDFPAVTAEINVSIYF